MANILVTGGRGFLGRHVVAELQLKGHNVTITEHNRWFSLTETDDVYGFLAEEQPEIIVHCAALVGGIGANAARPADFLYENAMMGLNLMHEAQVLGVKKFVNIGTVCMYPKHAPVPFHEDGMWLGKPEETNWPYGEAKRMLMVYGQALRKQHGMNVVTLIPTNLYGIGDHYDDDKSHVIPALIKRFVSAVRSGEQTVTIWGTGQPTREFLHVQDAADAIAIATETYDGDEPINLGSGDEISISSLAHLIAESAGFRGEILFDSTKPDGQPRRRVDSSRAWQHLQWTRFHSLYSSIPEIVRHYMEHGT